jgi:hypothetical protein
MKTKLLFGTLTLLAGSLLAADSNPKDDVKNAAKKLGDTSNYSWKQTTESPGGGGFGAGATEGKTEKGGATVLSVGQRDTAVEAVLKGTKGAIKTDAGWKTLTEAAEDDGGGGFNAARFLALRLQTFKAPAAEAEDLAGKAKELKLADGAYSGDLTEDGAKQLLAFRMPAGMDAPQVSGAKASVKFWVKDGALTKYEYRVQGTMSFNGNDRDINRTTTIEIKDVGTTKVTVAPDAAKKLS